MGQKKPTTKKQSKVPFVVAAIAVFLGEVVYVAGAASAFRQPKETAALAGLSIALGLAVYSAARRGTVKLPKGRLVWVLAALPVVQAASVFWSASPQKALESTFLTATWVIGILWLSTLAEAQRRKLAVIAAIAVGISAAVMILQLAGVKVFNFAAAFATQRLSLTGLSGNPADLAMAAVLLLPLLLVWHETIRPLWLGRALIVTLVLAALLTQTLTGIVALLLLFAVWLFQQKSKRLVYVAAGIGATLFVVSLTIGLGDRLIREGERIRKGDWYSLFSARGDGWTAAEEMIRTRPLVGIGAANYTHLYYPMRLEWLDRNDTVGKRGEAASHFEWAHCDPLQQVAELGVIGLFWMGALMWALGSMRTRAGPLLPLAGAAIAPFLLLHYPTHLAVGMIPISLTIGQFVSRDREAQQIDWKKARKPVAGVLIVLAVLSTAWQIRRLAIDVWMGSLEVRIILSRGLQSQTRAQLGAALEREILPRVGNHPLHAPSLWRTVGRARLIRSEFVRAETAFRTAYSGWPHEDAEFYLGISLAAQGRRNEGLQHLGRVCRSNPTLTQMISDKNLRTAVQDIVAAHKAR